MGDIFSIIFQFCVDTKLLGISLFIWALIPLILSILRLIIRGNKQ